MAYTALYRKYRPGVFEDVRGQEHIVTTLRNQIKAGRVGHAYLFCGTRGTGKTTVAKIFAQAVNCEDPADGSPCGKCPACGAIGAGSSMNVIEIDAASNNGVENIRQIREEVSYPPTDGRYKVYIIDEAHMLTREAFNALLKTLEEPPAYVIFILATTEAYKLPATILSRCQRYDFRRMSVETIAGRLDDLAGKEQMEVEDEAVRYIAKVADGSMRDALSLLDQCISFYLGEKLTYDHVLEMLGAVDTGVFSRLLRMLLEKDVAEAIHLLEELLIRGREIGQFVTDFTWYLRNLLLVKSSDHMEDVLDMSTENLALLKEEAKMAKNDVIMRYIRVFSELSAQIRYAAQKRVLVEIALIKLCRPSMETTQDALADRVAYLERKLEEGIKISAPDAMVKKEKTKSPAKKKPEMPKAVPEDIRQAVKNWHSIIKRSSGALRLYLKNAHLSLAGDNKLMLVFDDDIAFKYVSDEDHMQEVRDMISGKLGKEVDLLIHENREDRPFEESYIDLEKIVNMEIEVEDE